MAPPSPTKTTRRPYRVYLSAALHRRFIRATFFALLICYVEAILIGSSRSLFWSWFPLGAAGLRTILLFSACVCIFFLQIAQVHVGSRTSSLLVYLRSPRTLQTIGLYFASAWLFCETYMWSVPKSADLSWVIPGQVHERAKLNERPIFLRSLYFILAAFQSFWHLYCDNDRIRLPITNRKPEAPSEQGTHVVISPFKQIKRQIPVVLRSSGIRVVLSVLSGWFVYWLLLRQFAWGWTVFFAKLVYDLPRSQAHATGIPPYHIYLIFRSMLSSFLLMLLWESSTLLFTTFATEEPLKLGRPLTDASKDPNGSLLNGLKSKKELPRTFAFWELMLISERFPDRRKAIFDGLDREGGSTWKQLLAASLDIINGMNTRIETFQNLETPIVPNPDRVVEIQVLPKLLADREPLIEEKPILAKGPKPSNKRERAQEIVKKIAVAYGKEPDWTESIRQDAKTGLEWGVDQAVSNETKQQLLSGNVLSLVQQWAAPILRLPIGAPFRSTFDRRTEAVILGTPYSQVAPIVDAIDSISRLLICSLKEDTYGEVQADVPLVVRTFTVAIEIIKEFIAAAPPHWTDVYFTDRMRRPSEPVQLVLRCLEDRLGELLGAFSLYLEDVGVTGEELLAARIAAGEGVEMIEA